MNPPAGKATYHRFIWKGKVDHPSYLAHLRQRIGLWNRPGKTVKDKTALSVTLVKTVPNQFDRQFIRNQTTRIHESFDFVSQISLVLYVMSKNNAR
jgi:hypothetical protein